VLVLAFAPTRFAGDAAFRRETSWLAVGKAPSRDPAHPVRLPGQLAIARKRRRSGTALPSTPRFWTSLPALPNVLT